MFDQPNILQEVVIWVILAIIIGTPVAFAVKQFNDLRKILAHQEYEKEQAILKQAPKPKTDWDLYREECIRKGVDPF